MIKQQYTTVGGERWDSISYIFYGDASKMSNLIAANPGVGMYDVLPSGLVLDVPVIEKVEVVTDAEKLPPWKRSLF